MQDRYTGDIGDFGKLGLLRVLQEQNLSIGVNWYLTPDETHNEDGKYTEYLNEEKKEKYFPCDESLWQELKKIVDSGNRNVSALQNEHILKAAFYDKPLNFRGKSKEERISIRKVWHERALEQLSGSDVVFVDPDNGLVVPSAEGKPKENKYVMPDELSDYYKKGSSVIYYQHKARRQDQFYSDQHEKLIRSPGFESSSGLALKFKTTSLRYCFFIIQPRHREMITEAVNEMASSEWSDHFCIL